MRALLIVDVQNDFCEGGALAVEGGNAVAQGIAALLAERTGLYRNVFASRDWHQPLPSLNGGHFAAEGEDPDYVNTWPVHCVQGTTGAQYHPAVNRALAELQIGRSHDILKGLGRPDYSAFQGFAVLDGPLNTVADALRWRDVDALDVVGLATDYCVYQSTLDALRLPKLSEVRVLTDLCAGVSPATADAALEDMQQQGAKLVSASRV